MNPSSSNPMQAMATKEFWTNDFPAHWAALSTRSPVLFQSKYVYSVLRLAWLSTGILFFVLHKTTFVMNGYFLLTDWCLFVQMVFCIFAMISVFAGFIFDFRGVPPKGEGEGVAGLWDTPILMKALVCLRSLAFTTQVIVAILFWTLLAPGNGEFGIAAAYGHGLPLIGLTLELLLCPLPVYMNQVFVSVAYGLGYGLFSIVYTYTQNKPIYPPIDYLNNPGTAYPLLTAMIFLGLPACFLVAYGLHKLHRAIVGLVDSRAEKDSTRPLIGV